MASTYYRINSSEIPMLADQILDNYKRDKSYFEQYSPKFNNEFLARFEEKVCALFLRPSSQSFYDVISHSGEKIETLVAGFSTVLNVAETFLQSDPKAKKIRVIDFNFREIKEALNRGCIWEVQRSAMKIISQLELHLEEFIDKGFVLILLTNFHLLISKLLTLECELAELSHRHETISDESLFVDHQLRDFLETIIESTPAVFGENDSAKRDEYSVERLVIQAQYKRGEIH